MRIVAVAAMLGLTTMTTVFAAPDPMASRYGNTTLALDTVGTVTRLFYAANQNFTALRGGKEVYGMWKVENGKLCIHYLTPPDGPQTKECYDIAPHAFGDVWMAGGFRVTLVEGVVKTDTPEVLAALAAASRVGNTVVAKDPDGTETRLYWRADHTFSAVRPGWKSEGTWKVEGSSLVLHYDIARPGMGTNEVMKNAVPRKVGEVWGMADRKVTLVTGDQRLPN